MKPTARATFLARAGLVLATLQLAGCASTLPHAFTAPAPLPEGPAKSVVLSESATSRLAPAPSIPDHLLQPGATFTLADIIDVALRNSPFTRASYEQARAAAAQVGSQRAAYYPTLTLFASGTRGRVSGAAEELPTGTTYGPALDLSFLLLDLGGRAAGVEEARQSLLAADWTHNAMVQNVVLSVQSAYYDYLAAKAEVEAAHVTLTQTQTALDAAKRRHDAGLATIADVLQAQTTVSQAKLAQDSAEGSVMVMRGSLATAMGLPANLPVDVGGLPAELPLGIVEKGVDTLIEIARERRPDLAASRALAEKAAVHVKSVRSDGLPTLSLGADVNRTYYDPHPFASYRDNWSAGLFLNIPLFTGFATSYNVEKAKRETDAALAQTASLDQQVVLQVWTSYYALRTAAERVKTSKDLLASAEQSERVQLGRYKEGVGTILDLLSAQLSLASARAQEIRARSDWLVALAQLIHDTGALPELWQRIRLEGEGMKP